MRPLSDTIARLASLKKASFVAAAAGTRLTAMAGFGSNPGQLKAWTYVPDGLPADAPLVVVLHGCTQTAAGYDEGSGWSDLADRHGFALLYPEQQRANNPNTCFNWFVPGDVARDRGEALSIRQMIARTIVDLAIDPARVFITGLSAGGAMTAAMLATYPEVFAGGAIIAGLPFGCAASIPEAFDRMRGHGFPANEELAARVRAASTHDGAWPLLSLWQGTADTVVGPSNMDALIGQWRVLQDLPVAPTTSDLIDGHQHRIWRDGDGVARIETFSISGMGHGTPIDPRAADGLGKAMPYMLDVGISSTRHIAQFWGIADEASVAAGRRPAAAMPPAAPAPAPVTGMNAPFSSMAKTIDDALRAAGLVR